VRELREVAADGGDPRGELLLRDERDEVGVGAQVLELGFDVPVVDVDRDRTDLVDGEQRLHPLDAVVRVDADVVTGPDPGGGQVVRQPVHTVLELRVGPPAVTDDHARGALRNEVHDRLEHVREVGLHRSP
jgi:hypothetical protein